MSIEEFINIFTILSVAYGKDYDDSQIKIWYGFLKDIPEEQFKEIVKTIVKTNKYMPSIAGIREEYAKLNQPKRPNAEAEWCKVIDAVHKYGMLEQEEAFKYLGEYTTYVVQRVGWRRICMSDPEQQKWNKKEFIEQYEDYSQLEIENIQLGYKPISLGMYVKRVDDFE